MVFYALITMYSSNTEYSPRFLLQTLLRDFRVLLRIVLVVIFYWTVGWAVRRVYRDCERTKEKYWVDEKTKRGIWKWSKKEDIE